MWGGKVIIMAATITIRNLDENVQRTLKHRAVDYGRSFEAEIRAILEDAARSPIRETVGRILFDAAAEFREAQQGTDFIFPDRLIEQQRVVFE